MEQRQVQELAQQFIDSLYALEQGSDAEVDPLAMLFSTDATLANAALDLRGRKINGRDAIMQFWVEYKHTLGEARSKFHHITTSENAAGLFWTTEGTGPDGQPVRYHGASLLEFDELGLIRFFRGYYDTRELSVRPNIDGA